MFGTKIIKSPGIRNPGAGTFRDFRQKKKVEEIITLFNFLRLLIFICGLNINIFQKYAHTEIAFI